MGRKSRLKAQRRNFQEVINYRSLYDAINIYGHLEIEDAHLIVCESDRSTLNHWKDKIYSPATVLCPPFTKTFIEYKGFQDMWSIGQYVLSSRIDISQRLFVTTFIGIKPFKEFTPFPIALEILLTNSNFDCHRYIDLRSEYESKYGINFNDHPSSFTYDLELAQTQEYLDVNILSPFLAIIAFLNSIKNVELIDNPPPTRLSEIHQREYGRPLSTYKTLSIKTTRKEYQNGREGESAEDVSSRRLHVVRGHPRHVAGHPFIPDGTYWIPAHIRGDEQLGTIIKDYKVRAN